MRKTLIATSALAFAGAVAAAPASAADKMSVGVGGYMEQWVGYANLDDLYDKKGNMTQESAVDIQSDSEIFFTGSLESDMGLKFGVNVQLEGNANNKSVIDESFAWVSGEFGRIEIGARDAIHARTHYGISDVGVGLNAGDTQKWIPGAYLDTSGWIADNKNLIYISPRVQGLQLGLSYGSDGTNEYKGQAKNNDNAVWAAGINFNQAIGDASFKISAGHRNASMPNMKHSLRNGDVRSQVTTLSDAEMAVADATSSPGSTEHAALVSAVDTAKGNLAGTASSVMKQDDDTFTNFGVGVGFGGFAFNVAYAERDKGTYEVMTYYVEPDSATPDDDTDDLRMQKVVNKKSDEWDVWGASVTYSDGPMAVSLGHMVHETGAGTEREATMLSVKYSLAPGVDLRTSIMAVEDDTAKHYNKDGMMRAAEGTAIVTGLKIGF